VVVEAKANGPTCNTRQYTGSKEWLKPAIKESCKLKMEEKLPVGYIVSKGAFGKLSPVLMRPESVVRSDCQVEVGIGLNGPAYKPPHPPDRQCAKRSLRWAI